MEETIHAQFGEVKRPINVEVIRVNVGRVNVDSRTFVNQMTGRQGAKEVTGVRTDLKHIVSKNVDFHCIGIVSRDFVASEKVVCTDWY
ncbi:hypothetical protein BMS3Bbin04_00473 [bacterium BMS3Bbin04]|nr:hypothetical protein BMS3Bbin04_00473 [bacterium BMS3Bbin04]